MKKNANLTVVGVAAEIVTITDRLCAEHLDPEYRALCHKAIAALARKREDTPFKPEVSARHWLSLSVPSTRTGPQITLDRPRSLRLHG